MSTLTLRRAKKPAPAAQPVVPPLARPARAAPGAEERAAEWPLEAKALVALTLAAFCFGLVEMYSASAFLARSEGLPGHYFLAKQASGALAGILIAAVLSRVDYRRFRLWAWPLLAVVIVMLMLVVMPGTQAIAPTINGARRWLDLGVSFQPSEFAKLALIAWTAALAVKKADRLHSLRKGLLPFLAVWGFVALLVFVEPNASAALLLVLLASLVLFAGGARIGHFILLGIIGLPAVWMQIMGAEYRAARIAAFLNPSGDPEGGTYQIYQSLIAVGSGGLGGVGFGESRQKYGFLPEPHNDFLFSMIAEEWGLLGVLFVVAVFVSFLVVGYRIAAQAPDRFGYLLAMGMTNLIAVSAFLNMGVALGLLPTTGVALPFMSYGGSALLGYSAAVGILLSVARASRGAPA